MKLIDYLTTNINNFGFVAKAPNNIPNSICYYIRIIDKNMLEYSMECIFLDIKDLNVNTLFKMSKSNNNEDKALLLSILNECEIIF